MNIEPDNLSIRMSQAALLKVEVVAWLHWNYSVAFAKRGEQITPGFISVHDSAVIVTKHPVVVPVSGVCQQEPLNIHAQMDLHPHTRSCPHTSQA